MCNLAGNSGRDCSAIRAGYSYRFWCTPCLITRIHTLEIALSKSGPPPLSFFLDRYPDEPPTFEEPYQPSEDEWLEWGQQSRNLVSDPSITAPTDQEVTLR